MGGMAVGCARVTSLIVAAIIASSAAAAAQLTYDGMGVGMPGARESGPAIAPRRDLLANALGANARAQSQQRVHRTKVDLGPIVDQITAYLNDHGIPLHQDDELSGDDGIVFSAAFRVGETLPDMQFHIGDRGPLDAFYGDDGFRLSLSWRLPLDSVRHLALHLEGGEDGAFGNWGVVGLQWHHPSRPLVIGMGMPVALDHDDANGPVGVIWQIRMILP